MADVFRIGNLAVNRGEIKRGAIAQRYAEQIEAMYSSKVAA